MKYIIIPYVALGLVLSLVLGIEYNFTGQEMFPDFYGSPFVFKRESLGSSMEYFYSISGLVMCTLTWSVFLFVIDIIIRRLTRSVKNKKLVSITYKLIITVMIVFTTLNIAVNFVMLGHGFREGCNYWYWNMDREAKDWGMTCESKLIIFEK